MKKIVTSMSMAIVLMGGASTAFASDDVRVNGTVSAISSSSVTVGSLTCDVNSSTECENSSSATISCSAIDVGDKVRLTCRDGKAKNIELSGNSSSSSSSSSSSNSSSSSSSSSSDKKDRNLRDNLSSVDGVTTAARMNVRFQSSRNGKEQQLTGTVKLPLPSSVPSAADATAAASLTMTLTILRNDVAYALCTLRYDSTENEDSGVEAKFKLQIKKSNAKVRSQKGYCDVNLSKDGTQRGIPSVRKGDTMTLEETSAGVFMEGTF